MGQTASSLTFTLPFSLDVNRSSVVAVTRLESAVPEPATWMLMLFGFGAVGCGIRRKDLQAGVTYT
ncbi:PEPxxWA-CTERM sorting domain-containing protein [Sphingomonas glaciei]|uniref:PEPxxWA-CTERM sorting domain-containing protein n=1 Tax=Sphingomonas glaciei TaxID=2938948 RepID=A0ABY5N004_9SPHN|nr:PEPxxWA-CTERM sorting domain-containing protein [Sphingomonas glaciei]UUR08897.1 PEPxxWA-CTERM sorting domain-containing protein [Sphingomonas glaciei]